jgi:DNA-binding transcriptional MerR regulator
MATLYTPKHVAELLGISASAVRQYTTTYKRHFSTEATGNPRRFTEADIRFIAYVLSKTAEGKSHISIAEFLETEEGKAELVQFEWKSHEEEEEPNVGPGTMLVPVERLVAAQALLQREREERQREEEERQRLIDREQELSERLERTRQELGEALGELKAMKAQQRKPPRWWVALFGGE